MICRHAMVQLWRLLWVSCRPAGSVAWMTWVGLWCVVGRHVRVPCGLVMRASCLRCLVLQLMRAGATLSWRCGVRACQLAMTPSGMACARLLLWTLVRCVMPAGQCLALRQLRRLVSLQLMQPWSATRLLLGGHVMMCRLVCGLLRAMCCVAWLETVLLASVSWMLVVSLRCRHCQWTLMGIMMRLMCGLWRGSTMLMWLRWTGGMLGRLTVPWVRCLLLAVRWWLRARLMWVALRAAATLHCVMLALHTMCVCGRLCRRCM